MTSHPKTPCILPSCMELINFLEVTHLIEENNLHHLENICASIKEAPFLPAGICVYAHNIPLVKNILRDLPLAWVTVINFPTGNETPATIKKQIEEAILLGANELDIVLPYQTYLQQKNLAQMADFIGFCRETIHHQAKFKLILETGALEKDDIYALSSLACTSGVDFIKTSTGKIATGATLESTQIILQAIQNHEQNHQQKIGLKIAGGIHTLQQAKQYIELIAATLGETWLQPSLFRIGASKLLANLLS